MAPIRSLVAPALTQSLKGVALLAHHVVHPLDTTAIAEQLADPAMELGAVALGEPTPCGLSVEVLDFSPVDHDITTSSVGPSCAWSQMKKP